MHPTSNPHHSSRYTAPVEQNWQGELSGSQSIGDNPHIPQHRQHPGLPSQPPLEQRQARPLAEVERNVRESLVRMQPQERLDKEDLVALVRDIDVLISARHRSAAELFGQACTKGAIPIPPSLVLSGSESGDTVSARLLALVNNRISGSIRGFQLPAVALKQIFETLAMLGEEQALEMLPFAEAVVPELEGVLASDSGFKNRLEQYLGHSQAAPLPRVTTPAAQRAIDEGRRAASPVWTSYTIPCYPGTVCIRGIETNAPVAELSMELLKMGFPLHSTIINHETRSVSRGEEIAVSWGKCGYAFKHESHTSLVVGDNTLKAPLEGYLKDFTYREAGKSKQTPKVAIVPERFNTPDKIERALLAVYNRYRGASDITDAEVAELGACVAKALEHVSEKNFSSNWKENWRLYRLASGYFQAVLICIDLYSQPGVRVVGLPKPTDTNGVYELNQRIAQSRLNPEAFCGACWEMVYHYPYHAESRNAKLELTRMCLAEDAEVNSQAKSFTSKEQVIRWLIELVNQGDMEARLQLESARQHPFYQAEYHDQQGDEVLMQRGDRANNETKCHIDEMGESDMMLDSMQPDALYQSMVIGLRGDEPDPADPYHSLGDESPSLAAERGGFRFPEVPMGSLGSFGDGVRLGPMSLGAMQSLQPTESLLCRNEADERTPLTERVRIAEAAFLERRHAVQRERRNRDLYIKTLTGQTITIKNHDMNGPVADLCMKLVKHGYSLPTFRLVFMGRTISINDALCLQLGSGSLGTEIQREGPIHLVRGLAGAARLINCFLSSRVINQQTGMEESLMPENMNSIEKLERLLVSLYDQSKARVQEVGTRDYLNLFRCITRARILLASGLVRGEGLDLQNHAQEHVLREYLDTVMQCLELYKVPFIDHQNQHVTELLNQSDMRQRQEAERIRSVRPSGEMCLVMVGDREFMMDKEVLAARCQFAGGAIHFKERVNTVDMSCIPPGPANNLLHQYLTTGDIQELDRLTAGGTIELFRVAGQFQVRELEEACLSQLLLGIKFNLFTVEQLAQIAQNMPLNQALQQALEPLYEFDAIEQGASQESLQLIRAGSQTQPHKADDK